MVLLDGNPGDPLVEFRHLKFPVSEVGPMKVSHDQASGLLTVAEQVDLVAVAQADGSITVKQAALLLFGSATTNEIEKARRRLDKRVVAGELVKKDEGGASAYHPCLPRSRHAASTFVTRVTAYQTSVRVMGSSREVTDRLNMQVKPSRSVSRR